MGESCLGDLETLFGDGADCDAVFNDISFEQELARADPSGPPRDHVGPLEGAPKAACAAATASTATARPAQGSGGGCAADRIDRLLFGGHRRAHQGGGDGDEEQAVEAQPTVRVLVINSSPLSSNSQMRATLQGAACVAFRNTNFEHVLCSSADQGVDLARRALTGGAASAFNVVFISSVVASRRNGVSCSYGGVVGALQQAGCKAPIVVMDVGGGGGGGGGGERGGGDRETAAGAATGNVRVVRPPSGGFSVRLYVQLLRESLKLEDPVACMASGAAGAGEGAGVDTDESPDSPGTPPIDLPNPWLQWSAGSGNTRLQMHTGLPPNKATELVALQCRGAVFPGAVLPVFDVPLSVAVASFPNCLHRRQQRLSTAKKATPTKQSRAGAHLEAVDVGSDADADLSDRARKRQRIIRSI